MEGRYECVLHDRGQFRRFHHLDYDGLQDSWYFDPDLWSYFEVLGGLKEMGYIGIDSLWYHDPKDDNMLVNLRDNLGTKRMKNIAAIFDKVHLYVVHSLSDPIIEEYPSLEYFKLGPNEVVINCKNRHRFGFGIDKDCDGDGVVDNGLDMDKEPNIEEPNIGQSNIDSSGVCTSREKEKESSWDKAKEFGGPSSGINIEKDGIGERIDDEELVGERDDIESEEDSALDIDFNDSEEDIVSTTPKLFPIV